MPVRIVTSKQNARLKLLRRALTRPGRETRGLVGIEGRHLVEEAIRAGLRIRTLFVGGNDIGIFDPPPGHALDPETEVLLVPVDYLSSILETETPQPIAALAEMPDWTLAHMLQPKGSWPPLVIVLAALQDPGNLGTILRAAEAFGASGVIALPRTVSPWNPKAVRASAGSIFRMPVVATTVEECFTALREAGARILTTTPDDAEPANLVNFTGPVALIIGNEGNGVPDDIAVRADQRVTIPCPGPVESLNAAVATGVLLYEAFRQRSTAPAAPRKLRGTTR